MAMQNYSSFLQVATYSTAEFMLWNLEQICIPMWLRQKRWLSSYSFWTRLSKFNEDQNSQQVYRGNIRLLDCNKTSLFRTACYGSNLESKKSENGRSKRKYLQLSSLHSGLICISPYFLLLWKEAILSNFKYLTWHHPHLQQFWRKYRQGI